MEGICNQRLRTLDVTPPAAGGTAAAIVPWWGSAVTREGWMKLISCIEDSRAGVCTWAVFLLPPCLRRQCSVKICRRCGFT